MAENAGGILARKRETGFLWFVKLVTGPILVIVIFIHMIVNHILAPHGLMSYADVVAYFQNPAIVGMEIILLATVIIHSLLGVRSVILDMNPSKKVISVLDWLFILAGVVAIIYGIWLSITIAAQG